MHLTRFAQAKPYDAPGHMDMKMFRLQGREAGPGDVLWLGVSHLLPGGGTTLTASAEEKFYVVLDGAVTIQSDTGEETLLPWDSCRIAPHENRALKNNTTKPATILLAMPLPKSPA
jgi:quercetin dioxygenase-like cupin family protein